MQGYLFLSGHSGKSVARLTHLMCCDGLCDEAVWELSLVNHRHVSVWLQPYGSHGLSIDQHGASSGALP